jgi:ankyrin repeat protein
MTKLFKYALMAIALLAVSVPVSTFSADETFAAAEFKKAIDAKDLNKVQGLISLGANINAKDSMGRTPLYYAEQAGATNIATVLKANGAQSAASSETMDWGSMYQRAQAAWQKAKEYVNPETLKTYLPEGVYDTADQYLGRSK